MSTLLFLLHAYIPRSTALLSTGSQVSRSPGAQIPSSSCPQAKRYNIRPRGPWVSRPTVHRSSCPQVQRTTDPQIHRPTRPAHMCLGLQVPKSTAHSQVYRYTPFLRHMYTYQPSVQSPQVHKPGPQVYKYDLTYWGVLIPICLISIIILVSDLATKISTVLC